jgi:hypothetical protein
VARKDLFYFIIANLLLWTRALTEILFLTFKDSKSFFRRGVLHFKSGFFTGHQESDPEIATILNSLDQAENLDTEKSREAFSKERGCSVEHINLHSYYREKLGPRVRLTYEINKFETWPGLAKTILQSAEYRKLLLQEFGTLTGVFKCYTEKTLSGGTEPAWHIDSISKTGRLIFLLSDVSEHSAPLEYILESQLDMNSLARPLKKKHLSKAESWTPHHHLSPGSGLLRLTGRTGESFLFDSRGVHRSSLLSESPRYILMLSFTPKSQANRIFDLSRGGWPAGYRTLNFF